jgi:aryl-alcohol dehydrogenase-like predicted oxidoreductase
VLTLSQADVGIPFRGGATMSTVNRRNFLAATAGAATYLTAAGNTARAADTIPAPPQVPLGKTGITMSRVGQGTGMHGGNRQSDHTRMGFEQLVDLFHHSYERGITFFDLADLYGTHLYFREALRSVPREKVQILTKLWWRYDNPELRTDTNAIRKVAVTTVDRFRHEIATDYIDIVLLHCMSKPEWPDELAAYMEALAELKEKKQIRAVGVSCHNLGALETAATNPWVDVVLARINPHGAKMDGPTDKVVPVLRKIRENGKAIIGMKIFGEGTLMDHKEECVKFAQTSGLLDTMTIGFVKKEQVDDTLSLMAKHPHTELV